MVKARGYKRSYRKYRKGNRVPRPVARYVRSQIDRHVEDKEFVLPLTNYPSISTTWSEYSLFQPAQGTTVSTRIGNRIRMKSIQMYGVMAGGQSELLTDDPYNVVRIVIAMYKGMSGVTPLNSIGLDLNTPITRVSGSNLGSSIERVLYDRYVTFSVASTEKGGGDGYTPTLRTVRYYKRMYKNNIVSFGDNTITYPDRRIIWSVRTDSAANPSPGFIAGYIRIKWEDA